MTVKTTLETRLARLSDRNGVGTIGFNEIPRFNIAPRGAPEMIVRDAIFR
jgi:hypothetical protein